MVSGVRQRLRRVAGKASVFGARRATHAAVAGVWLVAVTAVAIVWPGERPTVVAMATLGIVVLAALHLHRQQLLLLQEIRKRPAAAPIADARNPDAVWQAVRQTQANVDRMHEVVDEVLDRVKLVSLGLSRVAEEVHRTGGLPAGSATGVAHHRSLDGESG